MNRYLKLVHMELGRFRNIYLSLFALILLVQMGGVWMKAQDLIQRAGKWHNGGLEAYLEYTAQAGKANFADVMSNSLFFMAPVFLSASVLLLYIFMIWYRDWLFKQPFIYRLLMLPTQRYHLYFSKLSAILIMFLGLVAFQLLLLPLEIGLFQSLVPAELRETISTGDFIRSQFMLQILLPSSFMSFVIYYGAGLLAVSVIFTAVLIERSYRLKGLAAGILYVALSVFIVTCPILIPFLMWNTIIENYLYPMEIFILELILGLIVGVISIWTGLFLIKRKVAV
ncbi:hypothetical protein ACFOLF_06470 [Paenibacillus sepulcri]|uniref:ABC transporter permease n=1 Tax=Paenibacillus sepulcri TaxID=359917 RepID=A0ABS7BXJ1_9BACL|nr:hypothetical protein [Paenibacillus sepulcri]